MMADDLVPAISPPGKLIAARVLRESAKTFAEPLFPEEAQAARDRKGGKHRENGVAGVGFNNFKLVLDRSSHVHVSQNLATRVAFELRSINSSTEVMPRHARSSVSRRSSLRFEA
jgi:hypothetical protein